MGLLQDSCKTLIKSLQDTRAILKHSYKHPGWKGSKTSDSELIEVILCCGKFVINFS